MVIFAGIDGTGPYSNTTYATEFKNSFVRQISQRPEWIVSDYQRGPGNDGTSTGPKAWCMANFVRLMIPCLRSKHPGVFLCGYSRGGAAAIQAAWHLQRFHIRVDCLILFDAVDRTNTISQTTIPSNVVKCFHAIRDPAANSRVWFGNCGRSATQSTTYIEKHFLCTHGGVGGLPWATANASGAIDEGFSDLSAFNFIHDTIVSAATGRSSAQPSETNVTPTMDRMVSAEVGKWMTANVLQEYQACTRRTREALQTANAHGLTMKPAEF